MRFGLLGAGWVALSLIAATGASAADKFLAPTPEELSMTSLPGYPGVAAVVLFREEITEDDLHVVKHYDRIKILTDEGKQYANVELPFVTTNGDYSDYGGNDKTLGEIEGRTIHSDGTVIPFTGKPYLKVIEKERGVRFQRMVFTLPDVEVGSIIEYRYATRISDHSYEAPDWYIQGPLYLKAAHYVWHPTGRELVDFKERPINSISWFPILPEGAKIVHTTLPQISHFDGAPQIYELTIKDVPPTVKEEYMPPIASYSYRVLFNFTAFRSSAEFWKDEGKEWSKGVDSFANPNSELKKETEEVIAGATSDEDKLKKIYATVMSLENTRFTREHERREDRAEGEGKVKSAADVLSHKRGTPTQLTELFIGMARAAGFKAYAMYVPDRSEELFTPLWLSLQQFDDVIAIVNVGGKSVYLDPGWRYTPYGHLAWEHTFVRGMRQVDGGTDFAITDGDDYKANRTLREANLNMSEKGDVTGSIKLKFIGASGVGWRHTALAGDDESLRRALRTHLEEMIPKTLDVKVGEIENLTDYEQPLIVNYEVKGTVGTPTGKRLVMPADIFVAGATATFPHEKRELAVYFHYSQTVQDAMRIQFAKGFEVEAVPDSAKFSYSDEEAYMISMTKDDISYTTRRNHIRNEVIVPVKDYDALRKYYGQFESKDQESVVLKVKPVESAAAGN
jgi:hypothetical protein